MLDIDWDGRSAHFNKPWMDELFATIDEFIEERQAAVAVTEFGVMRWEPGAAEFMDDQMDLIERRGLNHALWIWDPSWKPWTEEEDAFNFRHGPDRRKHRDVTGSELISVIKKYWKRNSVRPSNYYPFP